MPQFHETGFGRNFYDYHVPKIMNSLQDIARELKRANDLKEQELNGDSDKEESKLAENLD